MANAKGLGQIHTVNYQFNEIEADDDMFIIDLPGELSKQLQHHVRQGNYFKMVGLDMTVSDFNTPGDTGGQISGFIDYFVPTRGRCAAYRNAFAAMRTAMKNQGIQMSTNSAYDFRVSLTDPSDYNNTFLNVASLDGDDALALIDAKAQSADVFRVHNASLDPIQQGTPTFQSGFNTLGVQNTPTDFVLDEGDLGFTGNPLYASGTMESIPFQLSYSPGSTDISVSLQWRPDPALYIAVMCGLLRVRVDELDLDGEANSLRLDIAVHVAGWKSIMGSPDKKRRKSNKKIAHSSTKTTTTVVKKS